MTAVVVAWLMALAGQPPTTPAGIVRDPHDRPVDGARVRLICPEREQHSVTVRDGRFAFDPVVSIDQCALTVEKEGFEVARVAVLRRSDRLEVRLQIQAITQAVAVVAPVPAPPAFLSVTLAEADFQRLAPNTALLIEHARLLAGAAATPVVYVDGLPVTTLPPLDQIATVRVNADPFSAEYSDGDVPVVHLTTRAPARQFRGQLGTDGVSFGNRNVLATGAGSSSAALHGSVSVPVPRLPVGVRVDGAVSRLTTRPAIVAELPPSVAAEAVRTVESRDDTVTAGVDVSYGDARGTTGRALVREIRTHSVNAGVGALLVPEAGFASSGRSREIRSTWNRTAARALHEIGLLVVAGSIDLDANSRRRGVVIPGAISMGGSPIARQDTRRVNWLMKHVVRSTAPLPWTAGLIVAGSHHRSRIVPNEAGVLQFPTVTSYESARLGEPTGMLLLARGSSDVSYSGLTAAPFAQKVVVRNAHLDVTAGLRLDAQRAFGLLLTPRLTIAGRWKTLRLAAGTGWFARQIPDTAVLMTLARNDEGQEHLLIPAMSLDDFEPGERPLVPRLRARMDDALVRPREWMQRVMVERAVGRLVPALEYTWSRETRRLGSDRTLESGQWVDVLRSNRERTRHRLQAVTRYAFGRQHIAATYQWTRARDNGDGPSAYADDAGDRRRGWAPTAGIAPHVASVMGSLWLPGAISLHINEAWSSTVPYNVTSGTDDDGDGLFVERGDRARNSGRGLRYHSLSLYGSRRVPVPGQIAGHRFHVTVGVQATNLLDTRNYTSLVSVAGAGSFGRPLAALPGRSVRLLLNVD